MFGDYVLEFSSGKLGDRVNNKTEFIIYSETKPIAPSSCKYKVER